MATATNISVESRLNPTTNGVDLRLRSTPDIHRNIRTNNRVDGNDPLSTGLGYYVSDIRRHPPISREEEYQLAIFAEKGDARAAERLLTSNLRLVVKIARDYRYAQVPLQDLVQEGNLGLVMAVRKFDPHRGVKLSTYAAWWIRAYILKYILDNSRLVRWGTTQAQRKLFFSLRKEQQRLAAQGVDATPALLSNTLQVPEHEVVEMDRRLAESELSLDAPSRADEDGSRSLMDHLKAPDQVLPDALAEKQELHHRLRAALVRFGSTLEARDQEILRARILSEAPDTLEQVGARYGISRERARQLEDRLRRRLGMFLDREILGSRHDKNDARGDGLDEDRSGELRDPIDPDMERHGVTLEQSAKRARRRLAAGLPSMTEKQRETPTREEACAWC